MPATNKRFKLRNNTTKKHSSAKIYLNRNNNRTLKSNKITIILPNRPELYRLSVPTVENKHISSTLNLLSYLFHHIVSFPQCPQSSIIFIV